jgi:hypothetical protein
MIILRSEIFIATEHMNSMHCLHAINECLRGQGRGCTAIQRAHVRLHPLVGERFVVMLAVIHDIQAEKAFESGDFHIIAWLEIVIICNASKHRINQMHARATASSVIQTKQVSCKLWLCKCRNLTGVMQANATTSDQATHSPECHTGTTGALMAWRRSSPLDIAPLHAMGASRSMGLHHKDKISMPCKG